MQEHERYAQSASMQAGLEQSRYQGATVLSAPSRERDKAVLARMLTEAVDAIERDVSGVSTGNASIAGRDLLRLCQMAARGL